MVCCYKTIHGEKGKSDQKACCVRVIASLAMMSAALHSRTSDVVTLVNTAIFGMHILD